jgi:lipoyl(octanoyl) transferase
MVEFITTPGLTHYPNAVADMECHVAALINGTGDERVWFLEHPPVYTAGTSAKPDGFINQSLREGGGPQAENVTRPSGQARGTDDFHLIPLYETGRGGQHTYHGPGQRVAYVMLDLKRRFQTPDVRRFVYDLEEWIIRSLADVGVTGVRRAGRIGIWVVGPDGREEKIAALGIRIRRGVSFHGIAINVNPNLSHFNGIIPCGIAEYGVSSLEKLGNPASMETLDQALKTQFYNVFGGP